MSNKRKLVELFIDKKKEVIDHLNRGASCRELAKEYNVSPQTISNIKTKSQTILELWDSNCSINRIRKIRVTEHDQVNKQLLSFFKDAGVKEFQ